MYDELVKRLREVADEVDNDYDVDPYNAEQRCLSILQAADAIEELSQQVEYYHGCMNEWFETAKEYKVAYIAEHDARIAEAKRLYDAFYEANKKAVELTPLKIVLPETPKEG